MLGGRGNTSNNQAVRIYDPVANSWTLGTPIPHGASSGPSALINGEIYLGDGELFGVNAFSKYNPVIDTWTSLSPMPFNKNHAATQTDGEKLYIFGGRGGGADSRVQVYNPATDTWITSEDADAPVLPLPEGRNGTGKAVHFGWRILCHGGRRGSALRQRVHLQCGNGYVARGRTHADAAARHLPPCCTIARSIWPAADR